LAFPLSPRRGLGEKMVGRLIVVTMERISVVGCTGSGKTTMARSLADSFDIPHLEFDSVKYQPGWTLLPDDEFLSTVDGFTSGDR
jgi:MoxR-like ATPase